MKKISLLLVVLLAAGSASLYGQMAIGTDFKISGDATATAGYDIDDKRFGFKNEFNAGIKIELVAEQSSNNADMMDMEGWVGSIELKDFKIIIDSEDEDSDLRYQAKECWVDSDKDGIKENQPNAADCATNKTSRSGLIVTEPEITAKLKNGPLFLQIHAAPENKADLVLEIEDDDNTEDDPMGERAAESDDVEKGVRLDLGGAGVSLGYDNSDLKVALGITSDLPWDSDKDAATGSFVLSGDIGVKFGPAGLKLQVVQGLKGKDDTDKDADDTGVAGELSTAFGDNDAVKLTAGADIRMTSEKDDPDTTDVNESMDYEFGVGADLNLISSTALGAKYIYSTKKSVASDVKVTLDDKGGLVDRLGMGLTWGLFDLAGGDTAATAPATENATMDMFVEGKLNYRLDAMGGSLTPGATVTLNQIDGGDATVGLKLNAVLTEAVPATEFGLQWESKRLTKVGDLGGESGAVTAWAKISYS